MSGWTDCIGPVQTEWGLVCRWGVSDEERPDCLRCWGESQLIKESQGDHCHDQCVEREMEAS